MPREQSSGVHWITSSRDIKSLRRSGKLFRGKLVLLWVLTDTCEGADMPLVGIVTAKGFDKAFRRNRAKRRVRGCLMDLRHLLKPGFYYLVECRPGAAEADYQILVSEVQSILSRSLNC